jgi:hypothetical protein
MEDENMNLEKKWNVTYVCERVCFKLAYHLYDNSYYVLCPRGVKYLSNVHRYGLSLKDKLGLQLTKTEIRKKRITYMKNHNTLFEKWSFCLH